jgi:hypothetical protein
MTAFKVEAIDSSLMKPECWHRYVDNVFTIWPHGQPALKNFLSHLNPRNPNITFSMEMKRDRSLPFLDIMVNRCPANSLGYSVKRKATLTDRCLQAATATHHPLAHKRPITTTLMDRVNAMRY